jgi:hypothetical protein
MSLAGWPATSCVPHADSWLIRDPTDPVERLLPVNCGSPVSAAVLAFCTLTSRSASAVEKYRGREVDAVDAEAVQLFEG